MIPISEIIGQDAQNVAALMGEWLEKQYPAGACKKCGETAPIGPAGLCDKCLEAHELRLRAEDLIQRRLPASLWRANLANLQPRGNSAEITNHLYHAMRGRGSVYLFGGVGAGKSTMTAACFRALAHRGVEVWWDTAADLFGALKETWKSGAQTGEADLLRWRVEAATHGAFFLDDLGVGKIQPWELAALSALVDKLYTARRHDGGRPWIWLTSNRSLDGLRKWLTTGAADPTDADRIVSRLAEMVLPLHVTASDYRLEKGAGR